MIPAPRPDLGGALGVLLQETAAAGDEIRNLLSSCQRCRNRVLRLLDRPGDKAGHRMRISARLIALAMNHDLHRRGSRHVTGQDRSEPVIRGVTVPYPPGQRDGYLARLDARIRLLYREAGTWADEKTRQAVLSGLLIARHLYLGRSPRMDPDAEEHMLAEALAGSLLLDWEPLSDAGAEAEAAAGAAQARSGFGDRDGVL